MNSYIALVWDHRNLRAGQKAARLSEQLIASIGWTVCLDVPGLKVFDGFPESGRLRAYPFSRGQGVILGRLFPLSPQQELGDADTIIPEHTASKIIASAGAHLIQCYWGCYVAFIKSERDGVHHVIRDCSGAIPCLRTHRDNVDIVFSDVRDLDLLGVQDVTLDWSYITAFMQSSTLQVRRSALTDITEVLAGERATFGESAISQQPLWHPRNICQSDSIEDYGHAVHALRKTTQECISTWAATEQSIAHSLSGGFDSAAVLGCLMRAPRRPNVVCLNRYANGPAEDERSYARLAAEQSGAELLELPWAMSDQVLDDRVLSLHREAKPHIPAFVTRLEVDCLNELSKRRGFEAIWTGQGGDHLFYALASDVGVSDYLRRVGIRSGLRDVIDDAAKLTGSSIWNVLKSTLTSLLAPKSLLSDARFCEGWATRDALPDNLTHFLTHPWLEDIGGITIGKYLQIFYLAQVLNRHRPILGFQFSGERHPLLSQPLVELCLQIPTYLLLRGGRTRGLAREAFSDLLPPQIRERDRKGSVTASLVSLFRRSQAFIRDLILGGALVQQRVLDLRKAESVLNSDRPLRIADLYPLVSCIAAETFARSWLTHSPYYLTAEGTSPESRLA